MSEAHHPIDHTVDDLPPLEHDPELDGPEPGDDPGIYPHSAPGEPRAAGGVIVVRAFDGGPRIAVLESGGVVSLPKAEAGPGMSAETAAHRAAEAFTGKRVRLQESLGETHETLEGDEVVTWFWLAKPVAGARLDPAAPAPAGFRLHWIDVEEAEQVLTSEQERHLLDHLHARELGTRRRPFASLEARSLAAELEAFRDESAHAARSMHDPDQLDALMRAREEIERAEGRLARGDAAGARRARARAEREVLASLDGHGRALALQRALDRAPEHMRPALRAAAPAPGEAVSSDVLLAVQAAVDSALESQEREVELQRAAQIRATVALMATTAAVLAASGFGLFRGEALPAFDTGIASALFAGCGLLGGWVGEALYALREPNRRRHLALPLTAATGALAGLALGAVISGGFTALKTQDAALVVAATFAAGWLARVLLPRGTATHD